MRYAMAHLDGKTDAFAKIQSATSQAASTVGATTLAVHVTPSFGTSG